MEILGRICPLLGPTLTTLAVSLAHFSLVRSFRLSLARSLWHPLHAPRRAQVELTSLIFDTDSNAAQTPAGTPPAPVLSDPFPPAPSPPVVQAARVSPPPSPSTTPEDHTTAKSRKMWNDPGVSKKGAHVVGAASPAPNPTTTTTPASAPRTPRVKAAIASPEFQILVAEEVEHDPHKFTRPSPTPLLAPLDKRVYRGPILQDGDSIGTDEVPIQGGGAETPTSTPEQPEITSVEVTGTASAQEAVETVTDQSVAGAFVDDLLEAIGEAVGLGEESSSNSAGTSSTSAVEKRAGSSLASAFFLYLIC